MADLTQKDFKDFERLFSAICSENRSKRQDAVGLLTPDLMQKYLRSGKTLILPYGRKGDTFEVKPEDLKDWDLAKKKIKALHRPDIAGMPLMALEKASHADDKRRMREDIRSAVMYKVNGNTLSFRVTSSGRNKERFYHVRVRLEQWNDLMTDSRTWLAGARAAAVGNISFDCTCGRHQYWGRYLATISNCALTPKEQDFPKIRNPKLDVFCCKHTLKVFQQLKSGLVHSQLAKEMEKQANSIGYASPGRAKFLNKDELAAMQRAKGSDKEHAAALKAYREFTQARKAFRKKIKEPEAIKKKKRMEDKLRAQAAEIRAHKAEKEALRSEMRRKEDQAARDMLAAKLRTSLDMASKYKLPKDQVISDFSTENKVTQDDIASIIKDYSL